MRIWLQQANILNLTADVLVCSANPWLNLTGGVGAEIVTRYGNAMQAELHALLRTPKPRCADPGEVFVCHPAGLPYRAVVHAVAVDPFYHATPATVALAVRRALRIAAEHAARTVALTALATGFGDLDLAGFAAGVRPLLAEDFSPVEIVIVPQIEDYRFAELRAAFPEAAVLPESDALSTAGDLR